MHNVLYLSHKLRVVTTTKGIKEMSINNVFKSIKLLSDLTKKQKNKYLQDNGYYYQSKYGYENLFVKYAIENNQYDDLKTWYENCTYSSPDYNEFEKVGRRFYGIRC